MQPPLPPEIRVESTRQGVRYLLPPRETGPLKLIAVPLIGFGCLFGGFALFWMLGVLGVVMKGTSGPANVLFALFGLPFLAAGLGIVAAGFFVLRGHCEIEMRADELAIRERGRPFWWTRRMPLKAIRRFSLSAGPARINDQPVMTGLLSDMGVLAADVGAAQPRMVVVGYPRAWVEALAARLNADIAAQTGTAPKPTEVLQHDPLTGERLYRGDYFEPPTGTTLRMTEQAGGIVVVIPAMGFKGVSRFMLIFGGFWLLISTVVGVGFGAAALYGQGEKPPAFVFVVLGVFLLVGIAMLVSSVNLARRKASLRAARNEVIIVQQSLFGTKTFRLGTDEIAAICIGDSGMKVNEVRVKELQVHTADGTKHGYFAQLTTDELLWLATHLRHATGAGAEPPKLEE